jgi:protein-disulfide isomerase
MRNVEVGFLLGVAAVCWSVVAMTAFGSSSFRPVEFGIEVEATAAQPTLIEGWVEIVEEWRERGVEGPDVNLEESPVTIIEFGGYECAATRAWQPHLEALLRRYPDHIHHTFLHWPFSYHPYAWVGALAAECAAEQGAFQDFHQALLRSPGWERHELLGFATDAGVRDLDRFRACIHAERYRGTVEAHAQLAQAFPGSGAPKILVNGMLLGTQRDSTFVSALIEETLGGMP